jgi:cohesin complex subunit SA-1/2
VTASEEEGSSDSEEETTEDDGDDDDDDDFQAAKPKKSKTSPGGGARNTNKSAPKKKTKIQVGKSSSKSSKKDKTTSSTNNSSSSSSTKQGRINSALASLAKNVLPPNERTQHFGLKSLIAGLLSSYRPPKSTQITNFTTNVSINVTSPYTINLHSLAERVIEMHNQNPNRAQLALLNLLFRSVGGGPDTDFPMGGGGMTTTTTVDENGDEEQEEEEEEEEETILEDMDMEGWAAIVTDLVDDMRHVPANQILLCADPLGAVHQQNTLNGHGDKDEDDPNDEENDKKKGTKQYALGAAEFRKIYQEFWYILGYVALTEGGMATNTQQQEEEEEEEEAEASGSVVRLDAELVKELIGRVIELAPVGQPDVRAGATLAVISMSHAVLDQSAQLVKKMDVASRQYQAAKKGKNTSKAEALKVRIDSLKRSAQDLEEVVTGNFIQGLFVHRYR